jgi:hypothetical protein
MFVVLSSNMCTMSDFDENIAVKLILAKDYRV